MEQSPFVGGRIFEAMPAVMQDVGAVEKGRRNQAQGYQFRGIDDVYAAVQLVLAKHGVFVVPTVLSENWAERASKSGGVMLHLRSVIRHRFYATDGSFVDADTFGEAMDSGDKTSNKAMSVAMKYALIESLCIPTADPKDPENESPEFEPGERRMETRSRAMSARAPLPEEEGTDPEVADLIGRLRALSLKQPPEGLGFAPAHAKAWLKKYFGKESPQQLTKSQATDACLLLMTRMKSPETYPVRLEQFHSEGRVLESGQ